MSAASVTVEGSVVGSIGTGFLVLLGVGRGDSESDADAVTAKIVGLRVFPDGDGKMNLDLTAARGAVLLVSQFTLLADVRRGRRPSFVDAADPTAAVLLVDRVAEGLRSSGVEVATGEFGAHMEVALVNDGPVTIVLETVDGVVQ